MLTPNFSASQEAGEPELIYLTDTSSGSDAAIVSRRITLRKADNTFLVPTGNDSAQYITWALADTTTDVDVLEDDYGVNITVEWIDVSSAVLYTKTILYGFTLYGETFDYSLSQRLAANPLLINDNDFFPNKALLRTLIDSGNQAISLASDIAAAQQCYDRANELRNNSQYYFNTTG
jgi:hypothetical protein